MPKVQVFRPTFSASRFESGRQCFESHDGGSMKIGPMAFSGPMVLPILDDRKTQTRRVMNPQLHEVRWDEEGVWDGKCLRAKGVMLLAENGRKIRNPYGLPGDQLYISERIEWLDIKPDGTAGNLKYLADGRISVVQIPPRVKRPKVGRWPGRTLPIEWARPDRLEITEVKVERVAEISEEDAKAEGAFETSEENKQQAARVCISEGKAACEVRDYFRQLWNSINKKRSFGWDVNPYVWVVSFKRV